MTMQSAMLTDSTVGFAWKKVVLDGRRAGEVVSGSSGHRCPRSGGYFAKPQVFEKKDAAVVVSLESDCASVGAKESASSFRWPFRILGFDVIYTQPVVDFHDDTFSLDSQPQQKPTSLIDRRLISIDDGIQAACLAFVAPVVELYLVAVSQMTHSVAKGWVGMEKNPGVRIWFTAHRRFEDKIFELQRRLAVLTDVEEVGAFLDGALCANRPIDHGERIRLDVGLPTCKVMAIEQYPPAVLGLDVGPRPAKRPAQETPSTQHAHHGSQPLSSHSSDDETIVLCTDGTRP
jgi:hypothetical protein